MTAVPLSQASRRIQPVDTDGWGLTRYLGQVFHSSAVQQAPLSSRRRYHFQREREQIGGPNPGGGGHVPN